MYDKSAFSITSNDGDGNNQLSAHDNVQMYKEIFQVKTTKTKPVFIHKLKNQKMLIFLIKDSWIFILSTFLNFSVTLVAFPAVTVLIEPSPNSTTFTDPDWNYKYFAAIFCFILFNFSDYIGNGLFPHKTQTILLKFVHFQASTAPCGFNGRRYQWWTKLSYSQWL